VAFNPPPRIGRVRPDSKRRQLSAFAEPRESRRRPAYPVATLRNWEQGRVAPDPAAQSLLTVFAKNPKAVLDTLAV
jgi:hypothetical protein